MYDTQFTCSGVAYSAAIIMSPSFSRFYASSHFDDYNSCDNHDYYAYTIINGNYYNDSDVYDHGDSGDDHVYDIILMKITSIQIYTPHHPSPR
jgi:hypothetical protein